jgi:Fic family protein
MIFYRNKSDFTEAFQKAPLIFFAFFYLHPFPVHDHIREGAGDHG